MLIALDRYFVAKNTIAILFILLCNSCYFNNQSRDNVSAIAAKWQKTNPLGYGYHDFSGRYLHNCIEFDRLDTLQEQASPTFKLVSISHIKELSRELGLKNNDHFPITPNQTNSELVFFNSVNHHSYSDYIGVVIEQPVFKTETINAQIPPSYLNYFREKGPFAFSERCGHSYIQEFHVQQKLFLVIEILANNPEEKKLHESYVKNLQGEFDSKETFLSTLQTIEKLRHVHIFDPLEAKPYPVRKLMDSVHKSISNLLVKTSVKLASYPFKIKEQVSFKKKNELQEALINQMFKAISLRNDLIYAKLYPNEFDHVDFSIINEQIHQVSQRIDLIRIKGQNCALKTNECSLDLPEYTSFQKPSWTMQQANKWQDLNSCETPIYNLGRGTSCGVESYKNGRSKHCGIELYKNATDKNCPGYEKPAGPKILKEDTIPCQPEPPDEKERIQLDRACAKQFGKEWIFSDITEEYSHRPLTCPDGVDHYESKIYYRCIKLAKVTQCRHPDHGVELFRECRHPGHGVDSYYECRSPQFGIQYFESTGCKNSPASSVQQLSTQSDLR